MGTNKQSRVGLGGEFAKVGDYVYEPNGGPMGKVASKGLYGRVTLLKLTSGLYVAPNCCKVLSEHKEKQQGVVT